MFRRANCRSPWTRPEDRGPRSACERPRLALAELPLQLFAGRTEAGRGPPTSRSPGITQNDGEVEDGWAPVRVGVNAESMTPARHYAALPVELGWARSAPVSGIMAVLLYYSNRLAEGPSTFLPKAAALESRSPMKFTSKLGSIYVRNGNFGSAALAEIARPSRRCSPRKAYRYWYNQAFAEIPPGPGPPRPRRMRTKARPRSTRNPDELAPVGTAWARALATPVGLPSPQHRRPPPSRPA